ncbi:MAG: ribosome silencing factor [Terriglobia bacterium]
MKRTPTREQLERAAQAALEKNATDLVLLDLKGVVSFARYFLLCTGQSARQVKAISDSIEEQLRTQGLRPLSVEGYQNAEWVLLDYVDFVVHIFSPSAGPYYDLDRLWRRAARLPVPAESEASPAAS